MQDKGIYYVLFWDSCRLLTYLPPLIIRLAKLIFETTTKSEVLASISDHCLQSTPK